jgi:hypothetical protein
MIMLMLVVFFVTGAVSRQITRWTTVAMTLGIVAVLLFTRFTF